MSSIIRRAAAEFLEREIKSQLIMTVNRVEIVDHGHLAKIYVTIFPDEAEPVGLDEAKRLQHSLQQHLREQLKGNHLPFLKIVIDEEEKMRLKYGLVVVASPDLAKRDEGLS